MIFSKQNNFNFLRFIAACLVIESHTVQLTGNGVLYIYNFTGGQEDIGSACVNIFFVISGFLITASYLKTANIFAYLWARVLRIFPALIVVVILTTFVIGPWISKLPLKTYFSTDSTYEYLKTILLYPIRWTVPGFDSLAPGSHHRYNINGSLWSLSFEFTCYLLIGFLGIVRLLRKEIILFLALFVLMMYCNYDNFAKPNHHVYILWLFHKCYQPLDILLKELSYFCMGAVYFFYKDKIVLKLKYVLLASLLIIIASYLQLGLSLIEPICLTYIVFFIAFSSRVKLYNFAKYGDFSYGIYIYGFLIQQVLIYLFNGKMNNVLNLLLSVPIAILCGFISWHLIEKRCLELKMK